MSQDVNKAIGSEGTKSSAILGVIANNEDEISSEQESEIRAALEEVRGSVRRLLETMDNNASLLEDSVREVRTARQIAAESNRMARRRVMREGIPSLQVTSK